VNALVVVGLILVTVGYIVHGHRRAESPTVLALMGVAGACFAIRFLLMPFGAAGGSREPPLTADIFQVAGYLSTCSAGLCKLIKRHATGGPRSGSR
jgi:hypothetical protein